MQGLWCWEAQASLTHHRPVDSRIYILDLVSSWAALLAALLVLGASASRWMLHGSFVDFERVALDAFLLVFGFALAMAILASAAGIRRRWRWSVVVLQVAVATMAIVVPWFEIGRDVAFSARLDSMARVVESVSDLGRESDFPHYEILRLSDKRAELTTDGTVLVEWSKANTTILFRTHEHWGGFSGFVYSATGEQPALEGLESRPWDAIKLEERWYFVESATLNKRHRGLAPRDWIR